MATQFAIRRVLRCLSGSLLARYFEQRRPLPEVRSSLAEIGDNGQVWDLVPDPEKPAVEADMRGVFDLADEKGISCLFDEAWYHNVDADLHRLIDDLDGLENKVLAVLLAHEEVFTNAATMRQADTLRGNSWRRWAGLPTGSHAITKEMGARLAQLVADYFFNREGRGKPCHFERFLRQDRLHYIFLYPADHTHRVLVYENDTLDARDERPAFDVVFTFDVQDGILSVWTTGSKDVKEGLKKMFCETVFGRNIEAQDRLATRFRLGTFLQGTQHLELEPADGIKSVSLKRIKLAPLAGTERIEFETAPRSRATDIALVVKSHLAHPLSDYSAVEVSVQFQFAEESGRRARSFTFDLNASGFSNLHSKPDEYRALGEKYLRIWKVDVPNESA